jgi:predicted Zn-dependent peptidase
MKINLKKEKEPNMIEIKKMSCGTRIVMEQIPYLNSVAIGIWVRAGAVDENPKTAGISHFIEHMMFKGTETRSAKKLAEDVDNIGAQINAFTGKEATCYYIKSLASNAVAATEILLDMFLNSTFDKVELEKEKNVIYEEIKMIKDTPDEEVHDMICEMIFADHPLGNSITGTRSSLKGMTRNTLLKYIKDEYTRDNIVIAIAGNFDQKELCSLFEERLMALEAKKESKTIPVSIYKPKFSVKVKEIEQTHLCMGTRSMPLSDDRYYAFSCLNNIMGSSMSSRLFQTIREERGLAYTVFSMNSSFHDSGYFNIYAGIGHDKVDETMAAILEELAVLKKDGVTAEELSKAKEQLKSNYIFGLENVNGRMFSIGKNAIILDKVLSPEEVLSKVDAVTAEDIEEVSKIISDPSTYSAAAISASKIPLKRMVQK